MTRSIVTEKLKLSIAVELLNDFIETTIARINRGEELSEEELEHLQRSINFWESQTSKKKITHDNSI
jgi:hypothetical protein